MPPPGFEALPLTVSGWSGLVVPIPTCPAPSMAIAVKGDVVLLRVMPSVIVVPRPLLLQFCAADARSSSADDTVVPLNAAMLTSPSSMPDVTGSTAPETPA